jgi:hypothetical protein
MSRNSSGTYSQPGGTAAVSGATIDPTAFNTLITDLGAELTNSLDRGGRGAMTAAMNMGGFKAYNAADPTVSTDLATKSYVDTAVAGGGTSALLKASNLSDLANAATARTNLGLTPSATTAIGTAAGNLVALNGSAQLPAVDGSLLTGLSSGKLKSVASAEYTTQTSLAAVVTRSTAPTSSSGTQILSISATTTTSTQIIRIRFTGTFGGNINAVAAIFAGTTLLRTAVALCTPSQFTVLATEKVYSPGASGTYTITARVGPDFNGGGTPLYVNRTDDNTINFTSGSNIGCALVAEVIEP